MATKLPAAKQKQIKALVSDFELDGSTDYARMSAGLIELGLKPDNKFIWSCINAVIRETESYDADFL